MFMSTSPKDKLNKVIGALEKVVPGLKVGTGSKSDSAISHDLAWRVLGITEVFEHRGGRAAGPVSAKASEKQLKLILHPDKRPADLTAREQQRATDAHTHTLTHSHAHADAQLRGK